MVSSIPPTGSDRKRRKQTGPERGIVFPEDGVGGRSTTAAGKSILIAALLTVDAEQEADGIKNEKNWRFNYNKHFMKMVEISVESPETALEIAQAGLDYAHNKFQFITENDEVMPLNKVMDSFKGSFHTGVTYGNQNSAKNVFEVPYNRKILSGGKLIEQINKWANYGTMESDTATALKKLVEEPKEYLDLTNQYFVLIGAGSAMGPFSKLLEHGANIIAIDIPKREKLWKKLITKAQTSAGTMMFPLSKLQDDMKDEKELFSLAGCDLLQQPAEILNWVYEVTKHRDVITVGNYTYLDGALHVKLSIAADAIIKGLIERRKGATNVAFLCTPTDIHLIPEIAHQDAKRNNGCHIGKPIDLLMNFLSGGSQLRKNALRPLRSDDGSIFYHVDGLSVAQGPNYALAKRLQHWRAMVAFQRGCIVSTNVAPSTKTLSVVRNRTFAWAYSGMPYFKPFEIFAQSTTNSLMAGLMIHDIQNADGPKNPDNRSKFDIKNTLSLFSHQGLHGGLWRCAYKVDSIGISSVIIHFLGGPKLFLVCVALLVMAPFMCYLFFHL